MTAATDSPIERLVAALRGLPDDAGMIEHNPDEGLRMFCCDGAVRHRWNAGDTCEHTPDCWYVAVREALDAYEAAKQEPAESSGEHAVFDLAEPWDYCELAHPLATRFLVFAVDEIGQDDAPVIASCREEANAIRIVACVNACEGIHNDDLGYLGVGTLRKRIAGMEQEIRDLRARLSD